MIYKIVIARPISARAARQGRIGRFFSRMFPITLTMRAAATVAHKLASLCSLSLLSR
jgi:hypothetical protein